MGITKKANRIMTCNEISVLDIVKGSLEILDRYVLVLVLGSISLLFLIMS